MSFFTLLVSCAKYTSFAFGPGDALMFSVCRTRCLFSGLGALGGDLLLCRVRGSFGGLWVSSPVGVVCGGGFVVGRCASDPDGKPGSMTGSGVGVPGGCDGVICGSGSLSLDESEDESDDEEDDEGACLVGGRSPSGSSGGLADL